MARLRASWRTSLPVVQQPRNPQSESMARSPYETVRLPKGQDAAACWFDMGAVQDIAATVEEEGGPSLIGSCVPPEATRMELVRAFTKYARAHRADLDLRATALVIPALSASFPC